MTDPADPVARVRPAAPAKGEAAFRTIGEVSAELGIAQHVLRYWEGRFPQLRPLQRAGNRRYYRPADMALVRRIHGLLNDQGYTVRGVQALLAASSAPAVQPAPTPAPAPTDGAGRRLAELGAIRTLLADALLVDAPAG